MAKEWNELEGIYALGNVANTLNSGLFQTPEAQFVREHPVETIAGIATLFTGVGALVAGGAGWTTVGFIAVGSAGGAAADAAQQVANTGQINDPLGALARGFGVGALAGSAAFGKGLNAAFNALNVRVGTGIFGSVIAPAITGAGSNLLANLGLDAITGTRLTGGDIINDTISGAVGGAVFGGLTRFFPQLFNVVASSNVNRAHAPIASSGTQLVVSGFRSLIGGFASTVQGWSSSQIAGTDYSPESAARDFAIGAGATILTDVSSTVTTRPPNNMIQTTTQYINRVSATANLAIPNSNTGGAIANLLAAANRARTFQSNPSTSTLNWLM
jgi:hypothetical protein